VTGVKTVNTGVGSVADEKRKGISFSTMGILFGVIAVVFSIIWFSLVSVSDEEASGDDVTWVG